MKDFQERVVLEKKELDEKIEKLDQFVMSDKYRGVSSLEKNMLGRQWNLMTLYSELLGKRIRNFGLNN